MKTYLFTKQLLQYNIYMSMHKNNEQNYIQNSFTNFVLEEIKINNANQTKNQ
jgi:hypothetical protein